MKFVISLLFAFSSFMSVSAATVAQSDEYYTCSVSLQGSISEETGKAQRAYLWIPDGCSHVKAVILAQQNMTEETIFKMPSFRNRLKEMGVALAWVAPWFSRNWDPQTNCQQVFELMMNSLATESGHQELSTAPIIPFGHSAQATFPWNFAAWNPTRTLCIISFHGDAPRTSLCGYGKANIEWGRNRNIDGIPGLMLEGEYEWWEARVNPALAFRMMYPESCISFLCDTGRGHFDCSERTANYIALFIKKAIQQRLCADGTLRKVDVRNGWLAERFSPDLPANDGDGKDKTCFHSAAKRPSPAPYAQYKGDRHDAFWYFDREMAQLTENRYAETRGKRLQYVGFEQQGKLIPYNIKLQGGMMADFIPDADGITFRLKPVYTDSTHCALSSIHGTGKLHIDVISGPIKKIDDTTFRLYPYEAGTDNLQRMCSAWLVAVGEGDGRYKGAVQAIKIRIPEKFIININKFE
jgi:hypothetical protein